MLRRLAVVFVAATLSHLLAAAESVRVWPDREYIEPAYEVDHIRRTIEIGPQTTIEARFYVTTKGNGVLTLPGLAIRVHDEHGDGITFRGGLLRCEWRDEDGDGFLDLVVGGWADHTDDRDRKIKSTPLRAVFRYRPAQRRFEPVVCPPEIYYWHPKP